jgi:hypothetical protein
LIYIQCTKKLLEELKSPAEKVDVTDVDPLYCWHAKKFVYNRKKCVLVMNNHTRYNFLLYGLKSNDFKNFTNVVIQGIQENLLADGFEYQLLKNIYQTVRTLLSLLLMKGLLTVRSMTWFFTMNFF